MKIKNSKKKFVAIAVCQLFFLTIGCGESVKPIDEPNNKIALVEIKKEPKIKEAIITDANVLYVTVEDDGTNRNGYAEYLLKEINRLGIQKNVVWLGKLSKEKIAFEILNSTKVKAKPCSYLHF